MFESTLEIEKEEKKNFMLTSREISMQFLNESIMALKNTIYCINYLQVVEKQLYSLKLFADTYLNTTKK